MTLAGIVQVKPAGVEAETDRFTVPVNPVEVVRVIVDVPEAPARIWVGETAPAEMEKSAAETTTTVMTIPWFFVPGVEVASVAVPFMTTV